MDTAAVTSFARDNGVAACACHDKQAVFAIGQEEFVGQFEGEISTRLERPVLSADQLTTVPLHVIGYTTSSDIPGMGRTTLDFDFSRPVLRSEIAATRQREFFPAVQIMRLHILVSTDAFKGKTLRSMSQSALRNADAQDFPPPAGSTYTLEAPVHLEDIANPGVRLATLKTVNTSIRSTEIMPARITTNKGFVLHAISGRTSIPSEERGDTEITYETTFTGPASVTLFDEAERSLGIAVHESRSEGMHRIRIPNSLWQGRATYYQISIDGLPRTGLMAIE
jgi:hypothetical protein